VPPDVQPPNQWRDISRFVTNRHCYG
jgi:hypothetical protein